MSQNSKQFEKMLKSFRTQEKRNSTTGIDSTSLGINNIYAKLYEEWSRECVGYVGLICSDPEK